MVLIYGFCNIFTPMVQLVFDIFLSVADWFLGLLFVHGDVEKFLNFNVFYFIFNCATVDLD